MWNYSKLSYFIGDVYFNLFRLFFILLLFDLFYFMVIVVIFIVDVYLYGF